MCPTSLRPPFKPIKVAGYNWTSVWSMWWNDDIVDDPNPSVYSQSMHHSTMLHVPEKHRLLFGCHAHDTGVMSTKLMVQLFVYIVPCTWLLWLSSTAKSSPAQAVHAKILASQASCNNLARTTYCILGTSGRLTSSGFSPFFHSDSSITHHLR